MNAPALLAELANGRLISRPAMLLPPAHRGRWS
jgi:hypothetical protein